MNERLKKKGQHIRGGGGVKHPFSWIDDSKDEDDIFMLSTKDKNTLSSKGKSSALTKDKSSASSKGKSSASMEDNDDAFM